MESKNMLEKAETTSLFDNSPPVFLNLNSVESSNLKLVEVSIEFLQFGEVDTMNEKYQAQVKIIAKWYDEKYDPDEKFDPDDNWNPKLFIENAFPDVKEDIKYKTKKIDDKTTQIIQTRISKGTFWERMELRNFPLDSQELSIIVTTKYKQKSVKLIEDPTRQCRIAPEALRTFRDQQKFKLYNFVQTTTAASYDQVSKNSKLSNEKKLYERQSSSNDYKHSKISASCFCSRKPGYYLMNVYSFNFLITCLSLTLFAIETKISQNRLSGTFTLILTSFSFKVVTSKTIPAISYLTSLDKYQIANIVYLVMCCIWHATCAIINIDIEKKIVLDRIALSCLATSLFLIQSVLVISMWFSLRNLKGLKKSEEFFQSLIKHGDDDDDESDEED